MLSSVERFRIPSKQGREIVALLSDPSEWINRKVESIQINPDGTTRRSVSFDFIVPAVFNEVGFIPLTPLAKEDLRSLNVVGTDGASLSTLIKPENLNIAVSLLASGFGKKTINSDDTEFLLSIVSYLPFEDVLEERNFKEEMLGAYYDRLSSKVDRDIYLELAQLFIDSFLFWVEIPSSTNSSDSRIVKMSYEFPLKSKSDASSVLKRKIDYLRKRDFTGSRWAEIRKIDFASSIHELIFRRSIRTAIFPNWSARYHFEFRSPLGLLVKRMWLGTTSPDGLSARNYEEDVKCPNQIAHATIYGSKKFPTNLNAHIEISPNRAGLPNIALTLGFFVYLILFLPAIDHLFDFNFFNRINSGSATPLLLLLPALFIGYLARPIEHEVSAKSFLLLRVSLMISSLVLVMASAILSGVLTFDGIWVPWKCVFELASLNFIYTLYLWYWGTTLSYMN